MGPLTKSDRGAEVCQIARKGARQIIRTDTPSGLYGYANTSETLRHIAIEATA
jgi:hypothetical protein